MLSAPVPLAVEVFEAGAVVFRQGEPGTTAYVVEQGELEVLREAGGQVSRVNLLGPGDIVGHFALLDGQPRSATVRARSIVRLVPVHRGHLETMLAQSDPVVQWLVQGLLRHLRRAGAISDTAHVALAAVEEDGPPEAAYRALMLARSLAEAIERSELELHYQPIVTLDTRRLAGFEALVRWRHPALGMIRPDEFVPLAERTGLIHGIGDFVLRRALSDWSRLRGLCAVADGAPCYMSINLSAPELVVDDLPARIAQALERHRVPGPELRLELTETIALSSPKGAMEAAQSVRSLGVGIALDDFGKGYAGLETLESLPFTCLKIDKAFVDRLQSSARSFEIVRAAIDLAHRLGMSTVCEGIEDEATAALLGNLGCDLAQGYRFGRPMPAADVPGWKVEGSY